MLEYVPTWGVEADTEVDLVADLEEHAGPEFVADRPTDGESDVRLTVLARPAVRQPGNSHTSSITSQPHTLSDQPPNLF